MLMIKCDDDMRYCGSTAKMYLVVYLLQTLLEGALVNFYRNSM